MKSLENRGGRVPLKLIVILAIFAVSVWGYLRLFEEPEKPVVYSTPPNRNTRLDVAYVGDRVCAGCHSEIAERFSHHPMGRSMTTPDQVLPDASGKVIDLGDLAYWIERRDSRIFHQEKKPTAPGAPVEKSEHEVRYVIGSGAQNYAYLVERGNDLYLSPIAWDNREKVWDLAKGYEKKNRHFDQKIKDDCLFCHTNRFVRVEGKPIEFEGLSIGCERCHGPGELHAKHPQVTRGEEPSIVNPAKLKPATLREDVCNQCHVQSYRRGESYDGASFDYRPGLSLEKFVHITPERFGVTRQLRTVGHVQQMQASRCYQASNGELGCISCHDPHEVPKSAERIGYYQKRCLECHAQQGCSFPADDRRVKNPQDDCISCHMPQLPPAKIGHAAITDHTIPRTP